MCVRACACVCVSMYLYSYPHELGSPPWMAPEQILGKPITLAVDVFALGAIIWELFTGKIPFSSRLQAVGIDGLQRVCRSERALTHLTDKDLVCSSACMSVCVFVMILCVVSLCVCVCMHVCMWEDS